MGCSHGRSRGVLLKPDVEFQEQVLESPVTKVDFRNDFGEYEDGEPHGETRLSPDMKTPKKADKVAGSESAAALVEIHLRCEDLHLHKGRFPTSFVMGYSKLFHDEAWVELGRTENVNENNWPNYGLGFKVPFTAEVVRLVRFEVYRMKNPEEPYDLSCQAFLGGAETRLIDTVYARSIGEGWLTKDLLSPKDASSSSAPPSMGRLAIWAEEPSSSKNMVSFDISANKLSHTDIWKFAVDPYIVIHRTKFEGDEAANQRKSRLSLSCSAGKDCPGPPLEQAILRSEVVRRRKAPKFKRVEDVAAQDMCHGHASQAVVIEVWDWFRTCKPRLIGNAEYTFDTMHTHFWKNLPLVLEIYKKKRLKRGEYVPGLIRAGTLHIDNIAIDRRFSLLDYIRGGTVITPIIAVDMTRGNLDPHRADSLHRLVGDTPNDYATALTALLEVLQVFQGPDPRGKDSYPVYGFGAKIPPCKSRSASLFSLTGDIFCPFAHEIDGVLDAYHNSLRVTTLHGPTLMQGIIKLAADWARPYSKAETLEDTGNPKEIEQRYFVLIILSKGCVEDQQKTLDSIAEAVGLALSIIVIGVGDEDHSYFENLNDEAEAIQQLSLQVSCRLGHNCHQVSQAIHPCSSSCAECHCKVATCPTRWECDTCGQKLCAKCGISTAQENASCPVYRRLVTFKKFNNFRDRPNQLASEALAKIPDDIMAFYKALDIKPRGLKKFETKEGLPLPRPKVACKSRAKAKASSALSKFKGAVTTIQTAGRLAGGLETLSAAMSEAGLSLRSGATAGKDSTRIAPSTLEEEEEEEQNIKLWDPSHLVPAFLHERWEVLAEEAQMLGYRRGLVDRALKNGVAEDSIQVVVENIVHCESYASGLLCYKDAMDKARPVVEGATSEPPQREVSKETGASRGSRLSLMGLDTTSDNASSASRSRAGTKESSLYQSQDSNNRSRSLRGTKDSNSRSHVGSKESNSRSQNGTLLRSSLKGSKEALVEQWNPIGTPPTVENFDASFALPGEALDIMEEGHLCTICFEHPIDIELRPCGHRVACDDCMSQSGSLCPLCRTFVTSRQAI